MKHVQSEQIMHKHFKIFNTERFTPYLAFSWKWPYLVSNQK